ncbi:TPA: transposase [Klebsiella quasipneumoniae subsp. similipneumoniae]
MADESNSTQTTTATTTDIPAICPNCGATGTVSIVIKLGREYYQCSECRYRWPVPSA